MRKQHRMSRFFLISVLLFARILLFAQTPVVSGPMLGSIELRDAKVWFEVSNSVSKATLRVNKKGESVYKLVPYKGSLGNEFNPITFTVGGLEPNTTYEYTLLANDKPTRSTGQFTTKKLWQWREPVPDFSFLTGSCSYFNEPAYDRPGVPYGKDSTIFASMSGDKTVWHSKRLVGMLVGFIGLIGLVGYESIIGSSDPLSIAMMLLAAISYSYAVNMISQKLPDVSGIAINGLAMVFTSIAYAPLMIVQFPEVSTVSTESAVSLLALGVFCTALAFISFFIVLKEIGPARASIGTYVNTAIAVVLGVLILSEPLTIGIIIGLPLVMIGSFLASRKPVANA